MQEQALQESADTRLSEQEASLIVALHSEQEQRDGATTLRDLAETLHISLAEAQQLLAQVRTMPPAAPVQVETVSVETRPVKQKRRSKLLMPLIAFLVLTAGFVGVRTWIVGNDEGMAPNYEGSVMVSSTAPAAGRTVAAEEGSPVEQLPFHTKKVLNFQQGTTSEFEVALRVNSDYAVHTPALPDQDLNRLSANKADKANRLEQTIFECLEYASANTPASQIPFFTVAVRTPTGGWMTMDVPIKAEGSLQTLMSKIDARQALKVEIQKALAKHWSELGNP